MNFLNRKMFSNGGGASTPSGPLGPNQIYDTVSGKIYNLDKDFVSDLFLKGRNLYPILKDDTLIKGSNVASALEKFNTAKRCWNRFNRCRNCYWSIF